MLHVNSDTFKKQSYELADQVLASGKEYSSILCITKGGMHLAYYMADALKIKDIRTYCCSSYMDDNNQGAMNIYYVPELAEFADKNILIVDDLIDSGKTLQHILNTYPNHHMDIAVLYTKEKHTLQDQAEKQHVHIYAIQENLPEDTWISFYYEEK